MLVAQSPDLLLVDEPVAGLTDEETEQVGNLLLELAKSHSIMVIEHDMEFVRQIARQVTVLHQGSVLCEGSMEEVQNDPRVIEVYLGQQPSITTHQMKILRIVVSMAWADGNLAVEEADLILTRLSRLFSDDPEQQQHLREELRGYLFQDVPVEQAFSEIESPEEQELIAKLSYDVIRASGSANSLINEAEAIAYQALVGHLNLSSDTLSRLEIEVP
jgi:urea transport system ATP-binding protein